jgi:hypothetical protein
MRAPPALRCPCRLAMRPHPLPAADVARSRATPACTTSRAPSPRPCSSPFRGPPRITAAPLYTLPPPRPPLPPSGPRGARGRGVLELLRNASADPAVVCVVVAGPDGAPRAGCLLQLLQHYCSCCSTLVFCSPLHISNLQAATVADAAARRLRHAARVT